MPAYPLSNPFVALRSYSVEDARRVGFHGRDSDIVLIQSRLYSARTTLLFAGSGVGKTSLIDARLAPLLEAQRWSVVIDRLWAAAPPLDALRQTMAATVPELARLVQATPSEPHPAATGSPQPLVLILDQFEEVFQHWRDSEAMDRFAQALAGIVHSPVLDARILFSMREEFLGELSVFDNLIPDLFGNCYRLKNPTRGEAEEIVEKTAYAEQRVECGEGLQPLLDDLLAAPRPAAMEGVDAKPSAGSRVPMPFLQIVCHRLWEEQLGRKRSNREPVPHGFLETYSSGKASAELDAYCREKLDALSDGERDVAAAAFAFLMTPTGAKMAYPVDVLARQADVDQGTLFVVLRKLSATDVRILREVAGGQSGTPWFELHHDLYARFLSDWKRKHDATRAGERLRREREEQQRLSQAQVDEAVRAEARRQIRSRRAVWAFSVGSVAVLLLWSFWSDYSKRYKPLREFALQGSMTPDADAYLAARNSLDGLRSSLIFSSWAHEWWARYWVERAQKEMLNGRREEAILSLTRSLAERDDNIARRQMQNWHAFGETLRTFRAPDEIVRFGFLPSTDLVFAELSDCQLLVWRRATGELIRSWSPGDTASQCYSIQSISSNSNRVVLDTREGSVIRSTDGNAVLWKGGQTSSASFSPDGQWAVLDPDGVWTVMQLGTGQARPLKRPTVASGASAPTARYAYSPFTGSLFAHIDGVIEFLSPDGFEVRYRLDGAEWPAQPSDWLKSANVIPLIGDRIAALDSSAVYFMGGGKAPSRVGIPDEIAYRSSATVSLDGRHLLLGDGEVGLCRLDEASNGCEFLSMRLLDGASFLPTSEDKGLVFAGHGSFIREIGLSSPTAGDAVAVGTAAQSQLAPGGRWSIAYNDETAGGQCYLVDLDGALGRRLIAERCSGVAFEFNLSGTAFFRQVERSASGSLVRTPTVFASDTLDSHRVENARILVWASDDDLIIARPDDTLAVLNIPSKNFAELTVKPVPLQTEYCRTALENVVISRDGRHAVVPEGTAVARYQLRDGRWNGRSAVPDTEQACAAMFSSDSSQFLILLNGNYMRVLKSSDGAWLANHNDRLRLLLDPLFASAEPSIYAISTTANVYDLVAWRADSEQPVWRTPVPEGLRFLNRSFPRTLSAAVAGSRGSNENSVAWFHDTGGGVSMRVRLLPNVLRPQIEATTEGVVRVLVSGVDGAWRTGSFSRDFADVPPAQLEPPMTWQREHERFSEQFDIRINEATGLYEPVTVPPPVSNSPKPSPARKQ